MLASGARRRTQADEETEQRRLRQLAEMVRAFWRQRGRRYAACTLDTFRIEHPGQAEVVERLRDYAAQIGDYIRDGVGVVLIGPPGTGKDHLLAALMHAALSAGYSIKWTNGAQLARQFRDSITDGSTENRLIRVYTNPYVFALSDPAVGGSPLSQYQRCVLYDIIETRCNDYRPTWATINVANRKEADDLIGAAIVGRMIDGALSLTCNWPSYRKSIT